MQPQIRIQSTYQAALEEFEAARRRAGLRAVLARFSGAPVGLWSYEEVTGQLGVVGRAERGQQTIPVTAIVGSVGRYNDFTRGFLPRLADDAERWARVRAAATSVRDLPPIEVYQVGEVYFVRDGNHRVSIARQQGVDYLEANVIEVRTRVAFTSGDSADSLIAKAEYAQFLEYTKLDRLRPDANLLVSVPGQYERLENLIEVFRYLTEEEEGRDLTWAEAVGRWYDEAYLPVVEVIRERGLLRQFPGRTEADLYAWLAVHRAAVERSLQWELGAEATVRSLALTAGRGAREQEEGRLRRSWERIRALWERAPGQRVTWMEGKKLDRYSGRLFGAVLVWLEGRETGARAAKGTLRLARQEGAHLYAVYVGPDEAAARAVWAATLAEVTAAEVQATGMVLAAEGERRERQLVERAAVVDLVIVPSALASGGSGMSAERWHSLLAVGRPVLSGTWPEAEAQLYLEVKERVDYSTALFVATYLAERWQWPLTVVAAQGMESAVEWIRRYLALHEVTARFEERSALAGAGGESVLLAGVWKRGRFGRRQLDRRASDGLAEGGALLLCP